MVNDSALRTILLLIVSVIAGLAVGIVLRAVDAPQGIVIPVSALVTGAIFAFTLSKRKRKEASR